MKAILTRKLFKKIRRLLVEYTDNWKPKYAVGSSEDTHKKLKEVYILCQNFENESRKKEITKESYKRIKDTYRDIKEHLKALSVFYDTSKEASDLCDVANKIYERMQTCEGIINLASSKTEKSSEQKKTRWYWFKRIIVAAIVPLFMGVIVVPYINSIRNNSGSPSEPEPASIILESVPLPTTASPAIQQTETKETSELIVPPIDASQANKSFFKNPETNWYSIYNIDTATIETSRASPTSERLHRVELIITSVYEISSLSIFPRAVREMGHSSYPGVSLANNFDGSTIVIYASQGIYEIAGSRQFENGNWRWVAGAELVVSQDSSHSIILTSDFR